MTAIIKNQRKIDGVIRLFSFTDLLMTILSPDIIQEAEKLTESTSVDLFEQIKSIAITTPLSNNSIETSYVVVGNEDNPPILLLHGFDSSLMEYRRLLPLLSENYRVWLVDLFGFGFTGRQVNIPYSPASIKTHLYSFWTQTIALPVILVGASMGGATAIDFTLTYPSAVSKLILLDSVGLTNQPIMSKFLFPPLGFFATEFLRNLKVRQSISKNAYFDRDFASVDALRCAALHLLCENWNLALISFTKSGGYGSFAENLPKLNLPTLILWGKQDKILGIKPANRFQELIPQAKFAWIDDCGHVPHLEKPEITAQQILNFVPAN